MILGEAKAKSDQRPCAVGHGLPDASGIHGLEAVLGPQCLNHHHEFVGGVDQGAVQVENDGAQLGRRRDHSGFTARRMSSFWMYLPAPGAPSLSKKTVSTSGSRSAVSSAS